MEQIVPEGPGSIRMMIEEGDDWVPAEVALYFEDVAPEVGTDTIAVLDLDASEMGATYTPIAQRLQIELTLGDMVALRNRLSRAIREAE